MDAFQQRLFNSQRETVFLLKPDAPKTNAFHVKDVVNIEPFLFDTMPPKDGLNVKPVLLKQNAPEMDAFQQRRFNSQRETDFLLKPDAPKTNARMRSFMSKILHVVNLLIEPLFCLTPMPSVQKMDLNVKPVLLKQNALEMDAFQQGLLILSVKPIFC